VCALLYGALAAYFWKRYWAGGSAAAVASMAVPADAAHADHHGIEHAALLAPFALHTWLLAGSLLRADGLYLGVGDAVSLILWLTVLIYGVASLYYRLDGLHALALPIAAVAVLLPLPLPSVRALSHTDTAAFKAHLLIAMLAYGLFTMAALQAMLMAIIERRLHGEGGALPPVLRNMPPLLTLEVLLFRIIAAGFVLLTLTIASGMLFSEELFGQPVKLNHKTVFGLLSWLIFAALLSGRWLRGWRGRTAVRWTLTGFLMLVLAYIGSKFVLEVVLGR
jgi:ABC-type uncharacterized transport system permease subunit